MTDTNAKRISIKLELCRRLGDDWRNLADFFDIPEMDRRRFDHGWECQGVWDWLKARIRLGELAAGLHYIKRGDLAELLEHSQTASAKHLFDSYIERWSQWRFALDQRFVNLTLLLDQGDDTPGSRWQITEQFQNLHEVLAKVSDPVIVVLGSPGSGKSTLLRHFELDCAKKMLASHGNDNLAQASFTFFVPLNDYKAEHSSGKLPLPQNWLAERWQALDPNLPELKTLLREKRLTLLLDALNEIPLEHDTAIGLWKEFLRQLVRDFPGNRVIFSCRSLDYSASLSSKDLPVPQLRIEPLTNQQVQKFIELHYPEHGAKLWTAVKRSPQLELLRIPFYLKMLIELASEGEMPTGRAGLFSSFVRRALRREIRGDNPLFQPEKLLSKRDCRRFAQRCEWKTPYELPEHGLLISGLSNLAFAMQDQGASGESSQVRIDYEEAVSLFDDECAEDILAAGAALGVLDEDLGRDEVLYVHQLMQEYFAARKMAKEPDLKFVRQEWRSELVKPSLQETLEKLADFEPLPLQPATGWEETTLMAAVMTKDSENFIDKLMENNLALAGRCAAQADIKISEEKKNKLRWNLVERTQSAEADLRARIAAGLALGELGDPRFKSQLGTYGEFLVLPMIEIPKGFYTIGTDENTRNNESPAHQVHIDKFWIGKFPVTNAEWKLFMQAGGYEDERWWQSDEDKAWRLGEITSEGPKQQWREHRDYVRECFDEFCQWENITSELIDIWTQYAQMSDEEFEAQLEKWCPSGKQIQPRYWNRSDFNNPLQPIVGISWFEARAYCAWISASTDRFFRLPTEAEWEAAARGLEGRRYAYGDDFNRSCCNTFESHLRRVVPIGVFPEGQTPKGLVDMTGNSWDWTSSLYRPYPYSAGDGREDPSIDNESRVVRGGSWFDSQQRGARASNRFDLAPATRYNRVGLRLVCPTSL